jgi:hypothetical protein
MVSAPYPFFVMNLWIDFHGLGYASWPIISLKILRYFAAFEHILVT